MIRYLISSILGLMIWGQASPQLLSHFDVSLFNNVPGLPTQSEKRVLTPPYHPGVTVGIGDKLNNHPQHQWIYSMQVGYFYHRLAQHGIQLYADMGYRYHLTTQWAASLKVGGGYLHSIPAVNHYEQNNDGEYASTSPIGRPQLMPTSSVTLSYALSPDPVSSVIFTRYQFWMQWPFVNQYVPLLPNVAWHIGVKIPLHTTTPEE